MLSLLFDVTFCEIMFCAFDSTTLGSRAEPDSARSATSSIIGGYLGQAEHGAVVSSRSFVAPCMHSSVAWFAFTYFSLCISSCKCSFQNESQRLELLKLGWKVVPSEVCSVCIPPWVVTGAHSCFRLQPSFAIAF